MRARRLAAVLLAAALVVGAGCGSESSGISSTAADELEVAVQDIRAAVARGDLAGASQLAAELEAAVLQWTAMGAITGDRAVRITGAIDGLETELAARMQATTTTAPPTTAAPTTTTSTAVPTTTTTTTTSTTTTAPEKPKPGPGKGKDKKDKKKDGE